MIAAMMATNQLMSNGKHPFQSSNHHHHQKKCPPVGKCLSKNCAIVTQNDCPTCYCYSNFLSRDSPPIIDSSSSSFKEP